MSVNTIPCGQLAIPALIARIASSMDAEGVSNPPFMLKPGFCRFCGHALLYAWSATSYVDGELKRVEWNEGDPIAERMKFNEAGAIELGPCVTLLHRKAEQAYKPTGLHQIGMSLPTVLLSANGACPVLTGEIFAKASAIAREKAAKRREAIRVNLTAKEMAAQKAARAAAKRLAGPMAEQLAKPPAPDSGEF